MSFRGVARFHESFSPESARQWWKRIAKTFGQIRGPHGIVIADETAIHIGKHHRTVIARRKKGRGRKGTYGYETRRVPASNLLWVSIEAKTMRVIHLHLSKYSTNTDCHALLHETKHRTRDSILLLHDRGPWYTSQSRALKIRHKTTRGGHRSRIECWNRQLKHRLDRFWRAFPPNATPQSTTEWLHAYAVVWNATRP
jgi:transposase-like protein